MSPERFPSPRLQLSLLGELQLRHNDAPPAGKVYGKMLALLAYLALENSRSHRREQLADLFWPELPADAARINLRQTLYHLRRILQDAAAQLVAGRDAVRLEMDQHWWLDVRDFLSVPSCPSCQTGQTGQHCSVCIAHMERAVTLYRGDFLAGLQLDDAPDFEQWRARWRSTLRQHMLTLLERLRDGHQQQGALARALQHTRHYLTLEPWHEASHRAAIGLLAAAGQPEQALLHYQHCSSMLAQELGTTPERATEALAQAIRAQLQAPAQPPQRQQRDTALAASAGTLTASFAERRQVTVMYCSLLAPDAADAEELAERLRQPYTDCAALLRQYGAYLLPAPGGSLLAYFGYPLASEDAARNAVRAALALHATCKESVTPRCGIHTAIIVTGHVAEQPDPAGEASAMAQRLCERAAPGQIHVSDSTRQLVHGYFSLQAGGSQALRSFRVSGASSVSNRLDRTATLAPLVGRTKEIAQLQALGALAAAGKSQCVLLRGEAGIGKSRLLRALAGTLTTPHWQLQQLQCDAAYQSTPWRPWMVWLERLIGCTPDDNVAHKRAMLARYLASQHSALPADIGALLENLLGINSQTAALGAETLRQQTSAALLALLQDSARRQPMLLAIEDLHWADPSTLTVLASYAQQRTDWPILTVCTLRNDAAPPAGLAASSTVLELAQLDDQAMTTLLGSRAATLPASTIAAIVTRAAGIALFAEELAHQAMTDPAAGSVPATLGFLLAARLDATGPARRLAQLAATVGRSVDLELLNHVTSVDADQLRTLQAAQLLVLREDQRCEFRHALIQQAAYQSQTRSDRQSAHRRVATALIRHFPQRSQHQPALIAQHLTQAADYATALPWWQQAGQRALAAHACAEAAEHLRSGLALLGHLPDSAARQRSECTLLLALGQALLALSGYGSAEAAAVYDRAYALQQSEPELLTDAATRFDLLWGLWMVSSSRENASFRTSRALVQPLLAAARDSGDVLRRGHANAAAANLALWQGDYRAAQTYAQAAIALCTGQPRPHDHPHGHDPQVAGLAYAAWAYQAQGQLAQAYAASDAAIALARQLAHPDSLCFALVHAATVHRLEHHGPAVAALAQEILGIASQYQLALWQVAGTMLQGWSMAYAGQPEGIGLLEYSAGAVRSVMPGILVAFLHPLAEGYGFVGNYAAQLQQIELALTMADQLDEHLHRARLLGLRASCLQHVAVPTSYCPRNS